MNRPPLEVADLIRTAGDAFIERNRQWIRWKHVKVLLAIARCRTAALGGHLDECTRCGHRAISYNSCRNRHCPKCQTGARERWLAARQRELLPTRYVHVVFTLPRELAPLALQNKKVVYDLLFRASAETLLEVARDPQTPRRGDRLLQRAAHLESKTRTSPACPLRDSCRRLVARSHALDSITLPVFSSRQGAQPRLSRQVCCVSSEPSRTADSAFMETGATRSSRKSSPPGYDHCSAKDWVVYAKRPFGGPEHVLRYLGRYTHRVAISNHRLVSFADGQVTFAGAIRPTTTNRSSCL